jgi:hypothetical protein
MMKAAACWSQANPGITRNGRLDRVSVKRTAVEGCQQVIGEWGNRRAVTRVIMATGLVSALFAVGISLVPAQTAVAATGIYHTINFQGKVVNTDGTNIANGTYSFQFKIYNVSSGGSALWTETKSLTVTDGIFQTNLGDTTALPGSVDFNTDTI